MIVYISIGNSDDKLTQAEWSNFCIRTAAEVTSYGQVHGAWFSLPHTRYQNACWCVEFKTGMDAAEARSVLRELCADYRQDSIAWANAHTEFIRPDPDPAP